VTDTSSPIRTIPMLACPACHSTSARTIAIGADMLRQCTACQLPYAPEYVDPAEIYVEGYHSGGVGNFGVDLSDPGWGGFLNFVGDRRIDILESVVRPPGRIVDVGCGPGHTLAAAKRRGWDTVGVELVPSAAQEAIDTFGLEVHTSTLEESGLPERSFDVVAATHVLEHMQDGAAFLTSIGRWVKPGGHIFIEVPNWQSIDRRGNHDRWYGLRPLEHMGHYSPRTLAATMRRIGFKPVAVRTPFYQYKDQTLSQALHDLGVDGLTPRLAKRVLTVREERDQGSVLLPNPMMRRVLQAVEKVPGRRVWASWS
jgi:SAM-dependent methyltransferase